MLSGYLYFDQCLAMVAGPVLRPSEDEAAAGAGAAAASRAFRASAARAAAPFFGGCWASEAPAAARVIAASPHKTSFALTALPPGRTRFPSPQEPNRAPGRAALNPRFWSTLAGKASSSQGFFLKLSSVT